MNRRLARPAVFLDRDGVLNRAFIRDGIPQPPATAHDLELLPGVVDACRRLQQEGFLLIMVTNQPDIARGRSDRTVVDVLNERIQTLVGLDDIRVCPHDDPDDCRCRKPRPGMIEDAALAWDVDLAASVMVGDRWRDIEAGKQAGCRTVFVDRGYREEIRVTPDLVVRELADAVPWIVSPTTGKEREPT